MRVLILHGYEGNGADHWQTWLARRLRERGDDVAYPALPDPLHPDLNAWLRVLERERRDGDVVVCHSLGCLLWLHHRAAGAPPAERVLLVAPPGPSAAEAVPALAGFFPVALEPRLAREARLVCSDDDPYCPEDARAIFAEPLGVPVGLLPGAGHINPDSGFGPWPEVLAWVLSGRDQGAKKGVEA